MASGRDAESRLNEVLRHACFRHFKVSAGIASFRNNASMDFALSLSTTPTLPL